LTLTQILDIEHIRIEPHERLGFTVAEQLYADAGAPTTTRAIFELLEEILNECKRRGVRYPRIILRRRIEMRKGLWEPDPTRRRPEITAAQPGPIALPAKSEEELIAQARASYTPDQFESWMRAREQARCITADADKSVIPIEKRRKAYG
jgi:hypothetical protein